jgi:hypothetical protein
MRLTDSLEEQATLEALLEESKPPLPPEARALHYLLATPFRYRPPSGSRFRAAYEPGVWYGAEELRTALAEKSYWRLRFLLDSPGTPDLKAVPHTVFRARVRSTRALDLTAAPFAREAGQWSDPDSYQATQQLAALARAAQLQLIRYRSVRDPQHAACTAVLDPAAFGRGSPHDQQTWFIAATRARVRCAREAADAGSFEFEAAQLLRGA